MKQYVSRVTLRAVGKYKKKYLNTFVMDVPVTSGDKRLYIKMFPYELINIDLSVKKKKNDIRSSRYYQINRYV